MSAWLAERRPPRLRPRPFGSQALLEAKARELSSVPDCLNTRHLHRRDFICALGFSLRQARGFLVLLERKGESWAKCDADRDGDRILDTL